MGYLYGSFYINGNTNNCTSGNLWFPGQGSGIDYNDVYRTNISNIYLNNFGRYAESSGLEFWLIAYVNNGNHRSYAYMNTLIRDSASGYDITARNGQKHIMIGTGPCPPPIIYGCTDSTASNYNSSATPGNPTSSSSCTYSLASASLSGSPSSVIVKRDGTSDTYTLTWNMSSTSTIFSRQLYLNGGVDRNLSNNSGTLTLSPPSDGTDLSYQLKVTNRGGTTNSSTVNIAVYLEPTVYLSVNNDTITQGQSVTLSWTITGDSSTMDIQPGVGSSNLVSSVVVTPTVTTTYTATVSGQGGTHSDEVTVTVLPVPSVTVTGPINADYGSDITVSYDATNVPTSLTLTPKYYDLDGNLTVGDLVTLATGDDIDGQHTFDSIPWGDRGPSSIQFHLDGEGYGGLTANDTALVPINIDQMPDIISIPESVVLKDEDPVITPDDTTTMELLVTDIDIPVPIKSNLFIKVEIDSDGNYRNIEQL